MARVTIYSSKLCLYCYAAKGLLKRKGVPFEEIDVTFSRARRAAMTARANGGYTVPQIFIGGIHVGGCDDLHALERSGKLDTMIDNVST